MAIEVIKHPNGDRTKYVVECRKCNCEFICEKNDVYHPHNDPNGLYCICPKCNESCFIKTYEAGD